MAFNSKSQDTEVRQSGSTIGLRSILNFLGAGVSVADNPSTGAVDITITGGGGGGGATYSEVNTYADLPSAAANAGLIYVVRSSTGTWLINRKAAGLYRSNGTTWSRLGDWDQLGRDANFKMVNDTDTSKVAAFDASTIATGTTRTYTFPNKSGTFAMTSDFATVATTGAYSDLSGTPTIPTQYTDEMARDALGTALTAGTGISITPNDGADTITIANTAPAPTTTDGLTEGTTNLYFTDERVDDRVNALIVAGTGISKVYNDAANTLTLSATGGGGGPASTDALSEGTTNLYYTAERARDDIGAALVAGTGITVTPNDVADTITIASTITQYTDEMAQDAVGNIITAGTGISVSYNDAANTITVTNTSPAPSTTDTLTEGATNLYFTNERVDDRVAALLQAGSNVTLTYNDAANTLTIAASGSSGSGAPAIPPPISTRWYGPDISGTPTGLSIAANTLYGIPFYVGASRAYDRIAVNVTAGVAASNVRLGIYNLDSSTGVPGTLVLDAGAASTAAAGEVTITISQTLAAGWYLLGAIFSSAIQVTGISNTIAATRLFGAATGGLSGIDAYATTASQAYGALPGSYPTPTYTNSAAVPRILLRAQ